ncbi:MAG: HD domain-containing protein [Proteobacteria bacterium]|nr:HD domain-containing protein [Pseudomonadota bacterium]
MPEAIPKLAIDQLICHVQEGGAIRTGIDIFNRQGQLLLEKDVLVSDVRVLQKVKRLGVEWIPIVSTNAGGLWDKNGQQVVAKPPVGVVTPPLSPSVPRTAVQRSDVDRRIGEIQDLKKVAAQKYEQAKDCVKQTLLAIQETGGRFDFEPIADTVTGLVDFIVKNENAFSYLTREIFSYDDYLYNHSINVCTIGTVIMKKFNENFSAAVNTFLNSAAGNALGESKPDKRSFTYFLPAELHDISIGFFMHDLGKILIDRAIMNKPGRLTELEFEMIKLHSTEKGLELLKKNSLTNPYLANISLYHHARLFHDEPRCYPVEVIPESIPAYVKVCKLADIYDAMTSKRCYKDALNPVAVVTDIFHKYAEKDPLLQYILHSFVKSVGIYPPGSIVSLTNGQLAYVLDSQGPVLLPVTNEQGETLKSKPEVVVLDRGEGSGIKIDRRKPPIAPVDAYKILPEYLRKTLEPPR